MNRQIFTSFWRLCQLWNQLWSLLIDLGKAVVIALQISFNTNLFIVNFLMTCQYFIMFRVVSSNCNWYTLQIVRVCTSISAMKKNDKVRSDKKKQIMTKKKNISRLGGSGLSLDAFANAKSKNNLYNPAIISTQLSLFNFFSMLLNPFILWFSVFASLAISFEW